MRAQVLRAPDLRGELPEPAGPDVPADPENTGANSLAEGADEKTCAEAVPFGGGSSEKEVGTLPF